MNDSKRIWVWVGVAVVVIALAAWLIWGVSLKPKQLTGPVPVFAPQGQLTPQFPKNLILDARAEVNSSYSIGYSTSTNQYTAEWVSSSSLATLDADYKNYFAANGWQVTNSNAVSAVTKLGVVYASTSTANINVTLVAQGKGSEVTISYVAH